MVAPANLTGPERKAVSLLIDSVRERTRITWPAAAANPGAGKPVVTIHRAPAGSTLAAEGYRLRSFDNGGAPGVEIAGNDERGVLFGVGGLLRALEMRRDSVTLPGTLDIQTAPRYALRGHQLGYRPKTNSYDGWNVPQWESYIRDLAVFGANAIELIPPRSDDAPDSPHFPLPPMQMMVEMSRLAQEYGLECWIWYPAMDPDYSDPATVAAALQEWGEVFRRLPRIDAVFVPGGDPGHTEPRHLMALLEKQTANLRKYHPKAAMWVSPQGFNAPWMEQFFASDGPAAAVARRHRIRAAGARQPARTAAAHPQAIPHPLLSGHHALRERAVHGERLGCGLCANRGAGRHQPAAAG